MKHERRSCTAIQKLGVRHPGRASGRSISIAYTSGQATQATDTQGRVIDLSYNTSSHTGVTMLAGRAVSVADATSGKVSSLTQSNGASHPAGACPWQARSPLQRRKRCPSSSRIGQSKQRCRSRRRTTRHRTPGTLQANDQVLTSRRTRHTITSPVTVRPGGRTVDHQAFRGSQLQ